MTYQVRKEHDVWVTRHNGQYRAAHKTHARAIAWAHHLATHQARTRLINDLYRTRAALQWIEINK